MDRSEFSVFHIRKMLQSEDLTNCSKDFRKTLYKQ